MANETSDTDWAAQQAQKAKQEEAAAERQAQAQAAARRNAAPAGAPNPTATNRAVREEDMARAPRVGSDPQKRRGSDPLYPTNPNSSQGFQAAGNRLDGKTPQAQWDSNFHPPVSPAVTSSVNTATNAASAAAGVPAVPAAPPPVYGSGLWAPPKVQWTGPSLMPHAGPASVPNWSPNHEGQNFVVPTPATSPTGTPANDAAELTANEAMIQPGGAAGFWHLIDPYSSHQPTGWQQPDPSVAAAAGGRTVSVPGGTISVSNVPHGTTAPPYPTMTGGNGGPIPGLEQPIDPSPTGRAPSVDGYAPTSGGEPIKGLGSAAPVKKPVAPDEEDEETSDAAPKMDAYS